MAIRTIQWAKNCVTIIDQTQLPQKLKYITCRDVKTLWRAIRNLSVRGAPAIGVAAAFGVLLGIKNFKGTDRRAFRKVFDKTCDHLSTARPTAVNLFNVLDEMRAVVREHPEAEVIVLKRLLFHRAMQIFQQDRRVCRAMGRHGAKLIKNGARLLTVCNAGALATVDYGTAQGVMYAAKAAGRKFSVWACETRPLLQGARLTAWELTRGKIDVTLICDNMAATLMQQGKVDMVFTGADRIALNGDTANKIGTYNLAVLAKHHRVPFYIVAPLSTFDRKTRTGKQIPIEQRDPGEVTRFAGVTTAPKGVKVYNPAFDVTDHKLITGIVTEYGVVRAPFGRNIKKLLVKEG
jgi:methylthioribose-1-phosphate isomerase